MANTHETLESLFTDTANAIRAKTGGTADIVADEFPQAIALIPSGGNNRLTSDFLDVIKTEVTVGENSVSNAVELENYLATLAGVDNVFAVSMHSKSEYAYNEYASFWRLGNQFAGYRYRNGWARIDVLSKAYDAIATEGDVYDVFSFSTTSP